MSDVRASAPGRINLIGEHTDYNGGYVLPTILPHETRVTLTRRPDTRVEARSELQGEASAVFELGREARQHSWIDYVQGVTWALGNRARHMSGFDLDVSSTVPIGKGLSSSASLEVAVARALNEAYGLTLSNLDIALLCHRAESEFVGAPVGIMDQMVCSLGMRGYALFLDSATRAIQHVPLLSNAELAVIDSGLSHAHASGKYRTRRQECDEAAAHLSVRWLRDLTPHDLARVEQLPDPLNRRARHVVTENARVLEAVAALSRADAVTLGALFLDSHRSMRDDFEITTPEIDALVNIAARNEDVFGARMTGGGFGGAVIVLCAPNTAANVAYRTAEAYRAATARDGQVLLPSTR